MNSLSMMSSLQNECDRLMEAAEDGNVDVIKTLAISGVDVNAVVNPPVSNNCIEIITKLLNVNVIITYIKFCANLINV